MENTELENLEKEHMTTLVSCINKLEQAGYVTQFKAMPEGLMSLTSQKTFTPAQVKIVHFFRFEGESDPSDSSILYALEAWDGEKGTLVEGYGKESDLHITAFIKQVNEMQK